MQSKKTLLIGAMAALISLGNAFAAHEDVAPKFEIKSADGRYGLGVGGLLQTGLDVARTPDDQKTVLDAKLHAARLKLYGNAFDPRISYLIQMRFDTEKPADNKWGTARLQDFSVNGVINDYLQIATGMFAIPFGRQQVMPGYKHQFFIRSILDAQFGLNERANRDVGFLFHNGYHSKYEYAIALVKGGLGARVAYNHGEIDAYDPVDWHGGHLRFAVGASAYVGWDVNEKTLKSKLGSVDGILKVKHFTTNATFYLKNANDVNTWGAGVDAGYLINHKWEPCVHYALFVPKAQNHQITVGLNHYFYNHNVKAQLYAGSGVEDGKIKNYLGGLGLSFAI